MASQYHEVAYDSLLEMIGFESYQKLEEVLISGITSGIISGKMDQERKKFYVTSTIGRDVQLSGIIYTVYDIYRKIGYDYSEKLTFTILGLLRNRVT